MDDKKIRVKQRYQNLTKAYESLVRVSQRDVENDVDLRAGMIQNFEFTFELVWKTMKDMLEAEGVEVYSPKDVIRESLRLNYIDNTEKWLTMLNDRNLSVHTYEESVSIRLGSDIKNIFINEIKKFYEFTTNWINR